MQNSRIVSLSNHESEFELNWPQEVELEFKWERQEEELQFKDIQHKVMHSGKNILRKMN